MVAVVSVMTETCHHFLHEAGWSPEPSGGSVRDQIRGSFTGKLFSPEALDSNPVDCWESLPRARATPT